MKKVREYFYCDLCGKKLVVERGDLVRMSQPMSLPHNLIRTDNGDIHFSNNCRVEDICMDCAYRVASLVDKLKNSESSEAGD